MGTDKWNKVIEYLNSKSKATPEKVLNMLKTTYGKKGGGGESDFEVVRNSWPYIVIGSLANKFGTKNKNKKIPFTQVIRNWVKSTDYKDIWCTMHLKKFKNKKLNRIEWGMASVEDFEKIPKDRHVKNLNDIWVSKKGKKIRATLTPNNKFPIRSSANAARNALFNIGKKDSVE
jgi:hypothetical protein